MHFRGIAILTVLCLAIAFGGCRSKSNPGYDEVLMPLQTGSVLQRRVQVKADQPKPKKKKKDKEKEATVRKPEAEASATPTPTPEEESTPPTDRFR